MKKSYLTMIVAMLFVGLGSQAHGLIVDCGGFTNPNLAGTAAELAFLQDNAPFDDDPDCSPVTAVPQEYFQKWDEEGNQFEVDPGTGMYTVEEVGTNEDGETTVDKVTYDLTDTDFLLQYILVKDGSEAGPDGDIFYHLYAFGADMGKEGMLDVTVNGEEGRGISHISFFGSRGDVVIPEPGTLLLLGTGIAGLGFWRWRQSRGI